MRLGIPIFAFFLLLSSYVYSGESNTVLNDGKLLDIYFQLAPNSQGLLEGQCFLDMNWWRYLKSGLGYASQNSVVVTNSGNSNYTLSSSSQVYTLDVISTRPYLIQDVLKSLFNFSSAPDFVDLDAGVNLVMSSVKESEYGYINQTNSVDFFLQNIILNNIKPILDVNLNFRFGILKIGGSLDYTLYVLSANVDNEVVDSQNPQMISNSHNELGFERNFGVTAALDFDKFGLIRFGFDYHEYTGVYYSAVDNIGYGYILMDYTGSCAMELGFLKNSLGLIDQIPVIGLSGVQHVTTTFNSTGVIQENFGDLRFQLNLGLKF